MEVGQFIVNINSEQPEKMIGFYEAVVGLTPNYGVAPGAFMAGSSSFIALIIEGHSEIRGATKEPQRVLLNFAVSDLEAEQARLEAKGVRFIRRSTHEPGVGLFATFVDPDGNYCQLVEFSGQTP